MGRLKRDVEYLQQPCLCCAAWFGVAAVYQEAQCGVEGPSVHSLPIWHLNQ
jgi:hypothetical protein